MTEETDKGFWHGPTLDDVWVEALPIEQQPHK
jgi:hypothetical protein